MTEVQDLTLAVFCKPAEPSLNTKAAETKEILPYVFSQGPDVGYLIGACVPLHMYFDLMDDAARVVPPPSAAHVRCCQEAHRFVHQGGGAFEAEAPVDVASCGPDEAAWKDWFLYHNCRRDINRLIKKMGQAAHRLVWEARVLAHFSLVDEPRRGKKRPAT